MTEIEKRGPVELSPLGVPYDPRVRPERRPPIELPTEDDVWQLLKLCAVFDKRKPDNVEHRKWFAVSQHARWTAAEAALAINEFYATYPFPGEKWCEPGHVTTLIRRTREDRLSREAAELQAPRVVSPRNVKRLNDMIREHMPNFTMLDNTLAVDHLGRHVTCKACKQRPGQRCVHPKRGNRVSAHYVHPSRMDDERTFVAEEENRRRVHGREDDETSP